ncbi:hypothetical protein [Brevibacillus reuszeri]|uniref:hypothetical protein n=1 Tax=Brevibacillus reuszeri TaxID=54915 RepID=UPI0013DEE8AE|nr:hypothetical protein [Brevibacillus reuszeri]
MNIQSLQEIVKEGVVISEQNGVIYADFVEDNGDEFRLTQSANIEDVQDYLKDHGLIAE